MEKRSEVIQFSAFDNCTNLKKVTMLDNISKIGFYPTNNSDSVFENHNEDLTIYCYENSIASKYAIKYKIKYVYLKKPIKDSNTDKTEDKTNQQQESSNTLKTNQNLKKINDTTVATGKLPQAGVSITIIFIIILIILISIVSYKKYYKYKDIK